MDPLLLSVAVLLAVSGVVKVRASVRLGLGTPVLSSGELLAAVVVAGLAVAGIAGGASGIALAAAGVLLVIASSIRHAHRVRERRRRREASEARRLETYLRTAGAPDRESG